jgi:hypothetical protein
VTTIVIYLRPREASAEWAEDNPKCVHIEIEDGKLLSSLIETYLAKLHQVEAKLEDINMLRHNFLHMALP